MEVVRTFNNELSSLYEVRPPISKAKMTQITKSAIKGIKFYKHIVQSVEKFIQKCRPEYKVPGLYVVDSIVRQSRHQFGADKDVFGPRFVKNIAVTFQHLFKCAEDDRPKIIRVLNLWQKNAVFPIDVIQPLLDMGHPNTTTEPPEENQNSRHKLSDSNWKGWPQGNDEPSQENQTYEITTTNLEKFTKAEMCNAIEDDISKSSLNRNQKLEKPPEETVKFNTELLDFDYGDEDEEEKLKNEDSHLSNQTNALAFSVAQNLLSNPELIQQLQQMQQTIQQSEALKSALGMQPQVPKMEENETNFSSDANHSPKQQQHLLAAAYQQPIMPHNMQLPQSGADKDDRVICEPPLPPRDLDERSLASVMASHERILPPLPYGDPTNMMYQYDKNNIPFPPPPQPGISMMDPMSMESNFSQVVPPEQQHLQSSHIDEDERVMYSMPGEPPLPPQDFDERTLMIPVDERSRKDRSRSRSRSRGRSSKRRSDSHSPRRKRSRSRSRTRKNRSRSREKERVREKERERDRERERKRKGLPPIKKGFVSVCSTTIWLGHVPKSCSQMDISDSFGPYGTILSIDMIPPRGCAYVVMDRRQDGYRALQKSKKFKLQGSSIKMAWAPGKGVKGKEYKDYWEVELGVSYVPFEKVPEDADALDLLEEGGFIDEDSLPDHLRVLRKLPEGEKQSFMQNKAKSDAPTSFSDIATAPNMVPPPILPPTSVNLPMVMPHLMQPQFGLHLPGLLPPQAAMVMHPMGIPPPNPMLMVQQQSQSLMNSQTIQMVAGVPQIVPRTVPPVPSTLQNLKSVSHAEPVLGSPMLPMTTSASDATPTEEDGTSVSSPSIAHITATVSNTLPIASSQSSVSLSTFNPSLGIHNVTRPLLSVPPPVSTAGTPIPYPPPNVNFNFPPPGVRPPAQAHMPSNPQFPWMQKPSNSPFGDSESNQSASSRPVPMQSGLPMHMFGNRPPFPDPASVSNHQNNLKARDVGGMDRNLGESDAAGNRSMSPSHHDKNIQEMVISTDDESSMDRDYPRNDISTGPGQRFPVPPEFPRLPMNMPRMRGPPGLMSGPRFLHSMPMGSPFPIRMSGPRGMGGGHGMPPRMEMEFPMHPGPRGLRLPGSPHTPRRNENMQPHDSRDWYSHEFDGPPFERERERDRRYHGDWNRESWVTPEDVEAESQRMHRDRDGNRREDHREKWNRDGPANPEISKSSKEIDKHEHCVKEDKKLAGKPPISKSLLDDMFKLQFYQRDKKPNISLLTKRLEENRPDKIKIELRKKSDSNKESDSSREETKDVPSNGANRDIESKSSNESTQAEQFLGSVRKEKDRESRKRSRWGRTLSEEREFQQQKRNEIEIKFQSYEQSHAAQQPLTNITDSSVPEDMHSSDLKENKEPVEISLPVVVDCDNVSAPQDHFESSVALDAATNIEVSAVANIEVAAVTNTEVAAVTNTEVAAVTNTEVAAVTNTEVAAVTNTEVAAVTNIEDQTNIEPITLEATAVDQTNCPDALIQNDSLTTVQPGCLNTVVQSDIVVSATQFDCSDPHNSHNSAVTALLPDYCSKALSRLITPVRETQCDNSATAVQCNNLVIPVPYSTPVSEVESDSNRFDSNSEVTLLPPKSLIIHSETVASLTNPNDVCNSASLESLASESITSNVAETHLKNNETTFGENRCEDFQMSTEINENVENSNMNTSPLISADS